MRLESDQLPTVNDFDGVKDIWCAGQSAELALSRRSVGGHRQQALALTHPPTCPSRLHPSLRRQLAQVSCNFLSGPTVATVE